MTKKKTNYDISFTNELKVEFLSCDTLEKLTAFLGNYDINSVDGSGNNILHYYLNSIQSFSLSWDIIIPEIVKKGLNINTKQQKGAFGRSALHMAVFLRQKEIATYLVSLGADINSTDANGNTVISTAVMWYREQDGFFIELLLNHGANVHQKNNHGISALELAKSIANNDVLKYFKG